MRSTSKSLCFCKQRKTNIAPFSELSTNIRLPTLPEPATLGTRNWQNVSEISCAKEREK